MSKPKVLIMGKLPPPYMGPAIATQIILESELKEQFELLHVNTTINNSISSMGRWSFKKLWKNWSVYWKLMRMASKHKPDLVLIPISQTTMGFLKDSFFILIARMYRRKVLIQLRGSNWKNWLGASSGTVKRYVRWTLKKCAGVIVLGNNLRYLFEENFNEEQIHVVPNGRDFPEAVSPSDDEPSNDVSILYLANFLPSKGFEDVVQAIKLLKEKGVQGYKVHAAGSWDNPEYEAKCRGIIEEHALDIEIYPPVSGTVKQRLFHESDVFVFPPRMPEGHPWVVVEAMAASLPIIATDQGAIIESVIEGENGFIVTPEAPDQIADHLQRLIENNELRRQMSEASHHKFQSGFTEQHMVDRLGAVFTKVIAQ